MKHLAAKKLLACLLTAALLLPTCGLFAVAADGPYPEMLFDEYYPAFLSLVELDPNGDPVADDETGEEKQIALFRQNEVYPGADGAAYDRDSNTLTLTDFAGNYALSANMMGDDFTVAVNGDCALGRIVVWGDNWGCGLYITGSGSLTVNEQRLFESGVIFYPEGVETVRFTADPQTNLSLAGSKTALEVVGGETFIFTANGEEQEMDRTTAVREEALMLHGYSNPIETNIHLCVNAADPTGIYSMLEWYSMDDELQSVTVERYVYLAAYDVYVQDYTWAADQSDNGELEFDTVAQANAAGFTYALDKNEEEQYAELNIMGNYGSEAVAEDEAGNRYVRGIAFDDAEGLIDVAMTFSPIDEIPGAYIFSVAPDVDPDTLTDVVETVTYDDLYDYTYPGTEFVAAAQAPALPGDVDCDGVVGAKDARLALRTAVGLEELTDRSYSAADIDGNDGVTAADARLALRAAVGLEDFGTPAVCNAIRGAEIENDSDSRTVRLSADDDTVTLTAVELIGMQAFDLVFSADGAELGRFKSGKTVEAAGKAADNTFAVQCNTVTDNAFSGYFLHENWTLDDYTESADVMGEDIPDTFDPVEFDMGNVAYSLTAETATLNVKGYVYTADRTYAVNQTVLLGVSCDHANTTDIPGFAPTCLEVGFTAGVYCEDCGNYISGHEKIPAPGHKDADGDKICDVCGRMLPISNPDDGTPKLALEASYADDGTLLVSMYANHLAGLQTLDAEITYDPAVLRIVGSGDDSYTEGEDIALLRQTDRYMITAVNTGVPGQINYGFVCDGILDEEAFAEKWGDNPAVYNADHFAFAEFRFDVLTKEAADTVISITSPKNEGDKLTVPLAAKKCEHVLEVIRTIPATCTEPGKNTLICELCGERQEEDLPALGHEEAVIPAVAATCTEAGKTEGKRCSRCGEILAEPEETPALGHDFVEVPAVAPTCTEVGTEKTEECKRCGMRKAPAMIPATGHQWDEGKVTKAPTAEADGVRTFTCTVCGTPKEEPIEKLIVTETAKESEADLFAVDNQKAEAMLAQTAPGAKILDLEGKEVAADAVIGSGMKLVKADGTEKTIIVKGDNDGDGAVTAADARTALRIAVSLHDPNAWEENASLVNGAKTVSAAEARMILRGAVGLEKTSGWLATAV